MKKYYSLTLPEAMQLLKEKKELFEQSNNDDSIKISISMPTHRTTPDYKKDTLQLKILSTDAIKKLSGMIHKKEVMTVIENLKELESKIDYSQNLDGLVLFINKNSASAITLPVALKPEFIVDNLYDIRPLYKGIQQIKRYYILTVSQRKIRLIEAINKLPFMEFHDENFPFENIDYYTDEPKELAQDSFVENLMKEFFSVTDKRLRPYLKANPIPVIIAGDMKTTAYFRKMMDDDSLVVDILPGNYDNASLHEVVNASYPLIKKYIKNKDNEYLSAIKDAQNKNILSTDFGDIYKNAVDGNAETLYIENDFSLTGKITNNYLELGLSDDPDNKELSLDIINKIRNCNGNIIFVENQLLNQFSGMVLIRRY